MLIPFFASSASLCGKVFHRDSPLEMRRSIGCGSYLQRLTELVLTQTQRALCYPEGLFVALPVETWERGAGIRP